MKIAIVGSGISGLVAAHHLHAAHDITVFEAGAYVGGHTNTVDVTAPGPSGEPAPRTVPIDTGFIVFNEKTYPNFIALLTELGVAWQASDMSFSVKCEGTGLEYNGTSFDALFAQRTNFLRPRFWRMVRDILRFYREAPSILEQAENGATLGEFLDAGGYSAMFVDKHIVPMTSAIWSAETDGVLDFPLRFLVQFFQNHGFLQVDDRPQWLTVTGGSREYVRAITRPWADRIRLETPVVGLERRSGRVVLRTRDGSQEAFDRVVLACHSDTALAILGDGATATEREVVGAFGYQRNTALLHTDASLMPRRKKAWAAWNYHVTEPASELSTVTYWMNELQSLPTSRDHFVTLNRDADVDPATVERSIVYHHPIFTTRAVAMQARHDEVDGVGGVHFAGAYWRYGFHEDGVRSGLRVAERILAPSNAVVARGAAL
ncbi:protoporphyrinogen oxidase [Planctomycetes bacterium Pla163]|uniref:Protoporphyrinogen oxidase n=1 Tax=Rohdeia mirabilis TaxID=2528008 RepID=A0A518CVN5_9BACT|nr:protoporphyrinogen oxidase [Planctomycetes bacterium Pla163]